ncbi:transducin-like enhancer protein 4 isoform X1 [Ciconia boyciana]|uniref:transducin-like enhancer protein 4 isoform X1 n=1 Tax=Ciconia boyciana TaxID=52775 RepID=UPI003BA25982
MIRDLSKMYPQTRHPAPHQPAQPFKFTISESCDRIKLFQFLQAQYHSLKLECEKLASEKTEIQRHYVMYYEMSYGLNIEMHKQFWRPRWDPASEFQRIRGITGPPAGTEGFSGRTSDPRTEEF